ncbi:hypothetical protein [Nocardia africana]|uniref:Lipoprotein LpqS n=1 Tax=Nocardia africana TaxID=134964 RepID=A0A378X1Z1_9NOCA|nr:hypothetical protein [Nocardia africana]SUA47469.1 Uncharacterised protein [Nocardia africana]
MSVISRLRFGVPALALVALLVLVALHFDCVRPGGDTHVHPTMTSGDVVSAASAVGHLDLGLHVPGDDCCSHAAHCVLKSALPANPQKTMLLGLVLFLAMVALAAISAAGSIALAVRGPPLPAPTALTGRGILTRLCIDRR